MSTDATVPARDIARGMYVRDRDGWAHKVVDTIAEGSTVTVLCERDTRMYFPASEDVEVGTPGPMPLRGHPWPVLPEHWHFLGRCLECDAHAVATMTLGQVENWYRQGVIGADVFEGYCWSWATSSVRLTTAHANWETPPATESARAFGERVREVVAERQAANRALAERDPLAYWTEGI